MVVVEELTKRSFFFQAEDGIRDGHVTGVQTCALPISPTRPSGSRPTLESNGAYMVMTALAWSLKAWWALMLPVGPGRWQEQHAREKQWALGLEVKSFVQAFVRLPCQIVRTSRKLVYRLLSWNPQQRIFWRLVTV